MRFLHRARLRRHASQGMKFILVGGTAAMIELLAVTYLVEVLNVQEKLAGGLSLIPSVLFVFLANKYFTFAAGRSRDPREVPRFIVVYGFAIAMNYLLYYAFVHMQFDYRVAKALAIAIIAVWNYLMSHSFIFKKAAPDRAVGI